MKEHLRTCISCRQMKNKNELLRICRQKEGNIFIDRTKKSAGRGAWICKEKLCIEKAVKTRGINRAFSCNVANELYKELTEEISENR